MDGILATLQQFLKGFSPTYIYDGAYQIALAYLTTLSGVLLVIAIIIRLANSSLDSLDGNGRYAALIKSLLVWGSVLALYFVLAGLVINFFNVLYDWTRENGSIGQALDQLGQVLTTLDERQAATREDMNTFELLGDLAGNVPRGIAFVMFFISFVLLVFFQLFFQIAQAIGYTAALVFGTIAIPMAVSQKLSLLKGWGVFTATILVWPIVEALFMFLLIGMTSQLGLDAGGAGTSNTDAAGVYLVYTIMNLVMMATVIAAPFVTLALINNSGSITGLVTPFVGGAMAAGGAVTKAMLDKTVKPTANAAGSLLGQGGVAAAGPAWNALRGFRGGGSPGPSPVAPSGGSAGASGGSSGPSPVEPSGGNAGASGGSKPSLMTTASALDVVQSGSSAGGASAATETANIDAEPKPKPKRTGAQKARRGAIIHQQHKART